MPVVSASAVPQKAHSAFGITTRRGLSSVSSTMRHPEPVSGIDGPGAQSENRRAILANMPGLEMGAHPRPVRRGLFGGDARQMMACRRVAGAVIGAACRSDPAVHAAHRRRHWTFVTRAGHRERGAEGQLSCACAELCHWSLSASAAHDRTLGAPCSKGHSRRDGAAMIAKPLQTQHEGGRVDDFIVPRKSEASKRRKLR
jgi:hypothetical protein